jgi:hypothetical protein
VKKPPATTPRGRVSDRRLTLRNAARAAKMGQGTVDTGKAPRCNMPPVRGASSSSCWGLLRAHSPRCSPSSSGSSDACRSAGQSGSIHFPEVRSFVVKAKACEIRLRAERRCGELSRQNAVLIPMVRGRGVLPLGKEHLPISASVGLDYPDSTSQH